MRAGPFTRGVCERPLLADRSRSVIDREGPQRDGYDRFAEPSLRATPCALPTAGANVNLASRISDRDRGSRKLPLTSPLSVQPPTPSPPRSRPPGASSRRRRQRGSRRARSDGHLLGTPALRKSSNIASTSARSFGSLLIAVQVARACAAEKGRVERESCADCGTRLVKSTSPRVGGSQQGPSSQGSEPVRHVAPRRRPIRRSARSRGARRFHPASRTDRRAGNRTARPRRDCRFLALRRCTLTRMRSRHAVRCPRGNSARSVHARSFLCRAACRIYVKSVLRAMMTARRIRERSVVRL